MEAVDAKRASLLSALEKSMDNERHLRDVWFDSSGKVREENLVALIAAEKVRRAAQAEITAYDRR
jgi:hypothetical protein